MRGMTVWIARDGGIMSNWVGVWSERPTFNGVVWFHDCTTRVIRPHFLWIAKDFEQLFGFIPEPGRCRPVKMRFGEMDDNKGGTDGT